MTLPSEGKKVSGDRLDRLVHTFERHKQQLFRYIRHLVTRMGLTGTDTADDILGEVALVACEKVIRSPASVPTDPKIVVAWLMRIALFICLNRFRKGKTERRALTEYESVLREYELLNVIEEDPAYLREEIKSFLESLETPDRKLLELYLHDRLTSAEIGQALQMKAATARMRKSRLLEKLHAHFMR